VGAALLILLVTDVKVIYQLVATVNDLVARLVTSQSDVIVQA
jgi:hypothetical protein